MAKKYNRDNCDSTLRATVTDQWGFSVLRKESRQ